MDEGSKRRKSGRQPEKDFPSALTLTIPEDMRKRLAAFHKSCGIDRYPQETIRELLMQALSGDAVETAAMFARREVYRQMQSWTMQRLNQFLNVLRHEVEQIVWNITDGDVRIVVPEPEDSSDHG